MFSRCLTAMIVSITLIAGVQWYRGCGAPAVPRGLGRVPVDHLAGAPEELRRTWRELDEQSQRHDAFARFEARLLDALLLGEISLQDAAARSFYFCLQHYPEHLENIHHAEQGHHIKTKLAHNIMRALRARQETVGGDAEVVARFECELGATRYDPDAGTTAVPH